MVGVVSIDILVGLVIFVSLLLAVVLGWNNSGLTVGNLTNLANYRISLFVTLFGILAGMLIEGSKMNHSIFGNLIITHLTNGEIIVGAATSLAFFLPLAVAKIPVSLSNCVVGAFLGVAISADGSISSGFLLEIIGSWMVAPFVCMIVSIAFYKASSSITQSLSLPEVSWANRMILLVSVFYVSYALGANNGGLIFSFIVQSTGLGLSFPLILLTELSIYFAIVVGTTLFGKSIAKIVGEKIVQLSGLKTASALMSTAFVVWIFTQISVPISLTQVVIGGMVGAGSARGPTIVNRSELFSLIWHWILVTILCALLGYAVEYLLFPITH